MDRPASTSSPQHDRSHRRSGRLALLIATLCLSQTALALGQATAAGDRPADVGLAASRPDPEGVPTQISLDFYVVDIENIKDLEQEFTADLYLVARWRDPRLGLPESEDDPPRTLPLSQIWQPHFGVLNRRAMQASLPEAARVDAQGNVEYTQRLRGQFASPLDLRSFPFDRQQLEMQFISYRYTPDELEFGAGKVLRRGEFSVAGWHIGQPIVEITPLDIPSATSRSALTLRFEAEREKTFYLLTLVLPLILIGLMAWSVFWIDPSLLPAQLAIATASVFTLIAFRLSLMWSLPKVSYLTSADSFVLTVTLLVFAALGETVVAGRLSKAGREALARSIDRWARWIYAAALLVICLMVLT